MAVLLLLLFSIGAEGQSTNPFQGIDGAADQGDLSAALRYYDANQDAQARAILKRLLPKYPQSFTINETLGLIEASQGHLQSALRLLQQAATLDGQSALALANLGAAYLKVNRPREAVNALEQAAALDGQNWQTKSALGQGYLLLHEPQKAAAAFANAIQEAGDAKNDLLYNWALALYQSDQAPSAAEVLARIPTEEQSASWESLMGDVAEKMGNYQQAVAHLQAAATREPNEEHVNALAFELVRHWNFDTALQVYESGLRLFPASARLSLGHGIALFGNAQYTESAKVFSQLAQRYHLQPLYFELLGYACVAAKSNAWEDCHALPSYARQHPTNLRLNIAAATTLMQDESNQAGLVEARRLLTKTLASHQKSADAYYALGLLNQREGRWQQSIECLKNALQMQPVYSQAHYRLALAYSHVGASTEARAEALQQKQDQQQEAHHLDDRMTAISKFLVQRSD